MTDATNKQKTIARPPVVVILGHVDHGKTSILDKIKQTRVAEKESGGITQHIGAYQADFNGKKITFLDTPGHEAFSAIRNRGAKVADVAVLVIAAEEGVKPQTKEAIQIIKQAELPFVVALNKIDKEGANPQKVRQELAEQEVLVEDYGGTVPIVEMSAKTGDGIDKLLEMILLLAEMEELAAPSDVPAKGLVIESHMDNRKGLVATLIVQEGRLNIGDWVSAGVAIGKSKLMENFLGKIIKTAGASEPCVMLGWESAPKVGQEFKVVSTRDEADKLAIEAALTSPTVLFAIENNPEAPNKKMLNLVIKSDVQSSLEAIDQILKTIHSDEIGCRITDYGVGNISDSDIKNASSTKATVVGFRVSVDGSAKNAAEREKIKVQTFDIIYEMVEGIRSMMSDLLEPEIRRTALGKLKVLALFNSKGNDTQIVGGKVTQGKAVRGAMIDVIRNTKVIFTGRLGQLQQNKVEMTEVAEGLEAGIRFDTVKIPGQNKVQIPVQVGDVLEIYQEEKIKRSI